LFTKSWSVKGKVQYGWFGKAICITTKVTCKSYEEKKNKAKNTKTTVGFDFSYGNIPSYVTVLVWFCL